MRVLAGDIGATNARLAIARVRGRRVELACARHFDSGTHTDAAALLGEFLALREVRALLPVRAACLGVAGPVEGHFPAQGAHLTNLAARVDAAALAKACGLARLRLINDLEACALGLDALAADQVRTLQEGEPERGGRRVVLAPGTGLGAALAWREAGAARVAATEAGHMAFAPLDDEQLALWQELRARFGRVTYERVLSGPGLVTLARFVHARSGKAGAPPGEPSAVQAAAHAGDAVAREAVALFVRICAALAGDLALAWLPRGGVYIAGGIAPRLAREFSTPEFREVFNHKPPLGALLERIPVSLVLNPDCGLLGAALRAEHDAGTAAPRAPRPAHKS